MVLTIILVISGLVMIGLFLRCKGMVEKRTLHPSLLFGLCMFMLLFILSSCASVMGALEKFYSTWVAGSAGVGVSVLLIIVLFKLLDQELKKYKDLPIKGTRDD